MDPKNPKKKLTVLIDAELHLMLSAEAKRQGRTMTKLFHCAIASYLGLPMDSEEPRVPSRLTDVENHLRQLAADFAALERRVIRMEGSEADGPISLARRNRRG